MEAEFKDVFQITMKQFVFRRSGVLSDLTLGFFISFVPPKKMAEIIFMVKPSSFLPLF